MLGLIRHLVAGHYGAKLQYFLFQGCEEKVEPSLLQRRTKKISLNGGLGVLGFCQKNGRVKQQKNGSFSSQKSEILG